MNYKLIKEYPNSPALGTVCRPNGFGMLAPHVSLSNVSDFPEFWQIADGYEIRTFKKVDCFGEIAPVVGELVIRKTDEGYLSVDTVLENWVKRFKNWRIESVLRLSDDKIITVGDEVRIPIYPFPCTVTGFTHCDGEISVEVVSKETRTYSLNDIN